MLEAADPASRAQRIEERFKIAATVLDGRVRLEIQDGLRFVTALAEAFPGAIESVSISKPTLDDVFISRTGHRFWVEQEQQELD
jgi:ABC-2 type transport system ATP-binding protein